jgi:hypothetical protein
VFSVFYRSLEENEAILEIEGLKDKLGTCDRVHQCSSVQVKDRVHLRSCVQKKEDRSHCDRGHTVCDRE